MDEKRGAGRFWLSVAKALAFFGAYLGAQVVITSAFTMIFTIVSIIKLGVFDEARVTEILNESIMELTIISNVIAIFLCIFLAVVFRKKRPLEAIDVDLSFNKKPLVLGACAFLGIFGQIAILFILNIIPFPESWTKLLEENNSQITNSSAFMQIIAVAIMAPLAEEIVFRAGIQGSLKQGMPRWVAIVIASLIFGVMHGNPIGIIYASALGILMGWIYSKFNSIIPSMVFHLAFNSMSLILSLLEGIPFIICIISVVLFGACIAFIACIDRIGTKNDNGGDNNEAL